MDRQVFFGKFFHTLSFKESESVLDGFIAVENGKVSNLSIFDICHFLLFFLCM